MKKKNIILLIITCFLTLCVLTGLLVYAFDLQVKKDRQEQNDQILTKDNDHAAAPLSKEETTEISKAEPVPPVDNTTSNNSDESATDNSKVTNSPTAASTPTAAGQNTEQEASSHTALEPIVLAFAGDVNLDEDSDPAARYDAENKDILGCLSEDLLKEMNEADIMMLNNEFPYSTRGTETPNKSYTFRANPSRVKILEEMGVDIVSLANNHALDFGPDALWDTFDTLDNANIDYVGAGENLNRAKEPIYYNIGNKRIAFLAASHVVYAMDWYASDTKLGMIGTYDPTLILKSIKEAKANSDYVIIFVHWGVERENYPVKYQRTLAKKYIDAGAAAVIGCHPHVLQGFEYYKGKPIAYSLGNFWFNSTTRETGLLKLFIASDDTVKAQILPAMGEDTFTYLLTDTIKKKNYFDFMKKISYNVQIDENGFISEVQ